MNWLRLDVVATHPIQYYAPLFRWLTEHGVLDVRVFCKWEGAASALALDRKFGQVALWDVPLLDGNAYELVPNRTAGLGTHRMRGLDNPDLVRHVRA